MARIRSIKPDFFADEKMGNQLKREARLLFIGMWVFADDYGTIRKNPLWIKSNVFPYDEDLRLNDVKSWLDALEKARMIEPFEYNNEGFYNIRTFGAHQKVEKKSKPIVPIELKNKILSQSGNSRGIVGEYSVPDIGHRSTDIGDRNISPKGENESGDSAPSLTDLYRDLIKTKKAIIEFIQEKKPEFIEPYVYLWNLFAEERKLPAVSKINKSRQKKFAVRVKEPSFDFIEVLKKASQSDFLLTGSWFGFDWLMKNEINYLKVIEGNYDSKIVSNGTNGKTPAGSSKAATGSKSAGAYQLLEALKSDLAAQSGGTGSYSGEVLQPGHTGAGAGSAQ